MKIAIVGAGALGLYYGAMLQKNGLDVHFLLRRDYEAVAENGLKIFSVNGDFYLPKVKAYRQPDDIGYVDLVIVGLKTFANSSFAGMIAPLVGDATEILTLQNGLGNEEALAGLFGAERIIGGVAFLCSNRGKPGEVHHLGEGRIIIGEYWPLEHERLENLSAIFNKAAISCKVTKDLKKTRWEKLVWNIPFNGLSALLGQPVNQLLAVDATRKLLRELMQEVIDAANSQQLSQSISIAYIGAMIDFTDNMGEYKPSMLIDREERREMEIEAIFRKPLEYGAKYAVKMPRIEMLATLLEQIQ